MLWAALTAGAVVDVCDGAVAYAGVEPPHLLPRREQTVFSAPHTGEISLLNRRSRPY